jgi:hypothetical protein
MLSQKDAVYKATIEIMEQARLTFDGRPVSEIIPRELRKLVTTKLVEYINGEEVAFKATASNTLKLKDPAKMAAYASGLISNHWSRDSRLNGKGVIRV